MKRLHATLLVILLSACGAPPPAPPRTVPSPLPAPAAPPAMPAIPGSRVDRLMDSLSVRDKVAQLVMPWILGNYEPLDGAEMRQALRWADSLKVGGIIVGVGSPVEIAAKLNALQRAAPLPLLVASDLEGGTTLRLTVGGTPFPSQMGIGAGGREEDAYQMGRVTALEGRAVGIHLAFAPVADVNSNPDNPIINTRSFGADPATVSRLVAAAIRGMRDGGILSTAKHFPGHGDTDVDSHLSLPTLNVPWRRLDSLELVPFRGAIAAGVDAVMSAHIALPTLDGNSGRPGTLAPAILTGLLRDSLRFKGLVTTDALNMGAIVSAFGPEEASILAFLAGSDILLMPADAGKAIDAMVAAVAGGRITMARLDASVRRILEHKERLGLFDRREVDLTRVAAVVGNGEFQRLGREATERALVLLKDSLAITDSLRRAPRRIALVVHADAGATLGTAMATELRRQGHAVTLLRSLPGMTAPQRDALLQAAGQSSLVLFATAIRAIASKGSVALPAEASDLLGTLNARRPTMLLSFGSPYLIAQVPQVGGFAIGWVNQPVAEVAMAQALGGRRPFTGTLPIPVPPAWGIGSGLRR